MRFAWLLFFVVACAEQQPTFVATVDPPPPHVPMASTPHRAKPRLTCGEATLERAALVALGKGTNHPDVMAVDARLTECPDAKPSADECLVVAQEHADLQARGYGPRHPAMIANDAKRALCP